MRTFDTNLVVRLLVKDDPEQCARAEDAWRHALDTGGIFLPTVVLVEVSWVLRVAYKFDRETIARAVERLIDIEGVAVEQDLALRRALAFYEGSDADFSDHVILEAARAANALPVLTFDQRFARSAGVELVSVDE